MNTTHSHLTKVRGHLRFAHAEAITAAGRLTGARKTRAYELVGLIEDAIAFADRLEFVCPADQRYEELRGDGQ